MARRECGGALTLRRIGVALVALAFATMAAAGVSYATEKKSAPAIGESAPELKLSDQNGKAFVLAETLKEREFVVIAFYPRAFTSG